MRGETIWNSVSPASSFRKHSRTSSQTSVTEIPPKPGAKRSSRRSAACNNSTVPRGLLRCKGWKAAVTWISPCRNVFSGSGGFSHTLSHASCSVKNSPASYTRRPSARPPSVQSSVICRDPPLQASLGPVVGDSQGHAVGNLHKEDCQVFDKGKPQVITQFEVEQPGALAAKARQKSDETSGEASSGETSSDPGQGSAAPERFVAYLFDDVHLEFGDLAQVRNAAERHFSTLRPTDRAAIFTTSGRTSLDYTDDHAKLHETLLRLQPRPISGRVVHDCPEISYYQADQIVNKHDPDARNVAIQEASDCGPISPQNSSLGNPAALVDAIAMGVLSAGQQESRVTLGSLKQVVRAVSRMPGQRSVVLVSPGFIAPDLQSEYIEIIDRSVRSQIIISTLDARGLYVLFPYGDFIHQPAAPLGGRIPGDAEPP